LGPEGAAPGQSGNDHDDDGDDEVQATGALAEAGPPAVGVYASLVRAATARALARGVISGSRAAAVLDALDG
jgi:hypothetical protein